MDPKIEELEKRYQIALSSDERIEICEQTCAYLEEHIKKNPSDVSALIYYGVLSWEPLHESEIAIERLKKAIELDPRNVEARYWLATCYYHDFCAYEKAKQIAIEALEIDPKRGDCFARLACIVWDYPGDLQKAIEYFKLAVQYAPDCPTFLHMLITLLAQVKDIESAEYYLMKFIEFSKKVPIKINNAIERYYETVVTGRGRTDNESEVQILFDRIDQAKASINEQR